jgi:glutamate 5-kinase
VTVDDGAAAKVRAEGKSLLPIGMTSVEGDFSRGDVIAVRDSSGAEVARGLPTTPAARRACCAASRQARSSAC